MNPDKKKKRKSITRTPRLKPDVREMRKLTTQEQWDHHCYSSSGKHQATARACPYRYLHPNPNKLGGNIAYCKLQRCIRVKEKVEEGVED